MKFQNAINSSQAALQEGILPGGGVALYYLTRTIAEPMFKNALVAPFNQMCTNAGVFENMKITNSSDNKMGYDFKNKEWVDMFDAGIIDPFKVVRLALESATAIAMSLVSKEVAIVEEEEPSKDER